MTLSEPHRLWWSAAEIAAAGLPDLPVTKRRVNALAMRLNWQSDPELARRRKGPGGGWEYHWKLLPLNARKRLALSNEVAVPADMDRDAVWRFFDGLPESVRERAQVRLRIIQEIEALEAAGQARHLAVAEVTAQHGIGTRSVWGWFRTIRGVRTDDRLAWLAPRHRAATRVRAKATCSPEFQDVLFGDFLRLAQPGFAACHRRAVRIAAKNGWDVLCERTMRRRLNQAVSKPSQILARKGVDALKAMYPPQVRDKSALHAMEVVNADYHKFDVFVRWPAEGALEVEVIRVQMVAFQDIYSGRILSWRIEKTANKSGVALALGDMIEAFGIPDHMVLDNGGEFANKFLTGQAKTRNKFKIKDDDIPGLLVSLGVNIHWATVYAGQSKPIERAFRDMCDDIAKDPRFAGAYTGNRPDAKPEDYGSRAIDLEVFLSVLAEGIEAHNARSGRRSQVANGRSFIEAFEASYAQAPIRKATQEQRRIWFMGAEGLNVDRRTGEIRFMKNIYWAPWLHDVMGTRIVARFDPADLWAGLHVYSLQNEYLGHVECREQSGFLDVEQGRIHNKARLAWMKAEKAALKAARRLQVTDIAAHLDAAPPVAAPGSGRAVPPAEPRVVRPVFGQQPGPKTGPKAGGEPLVVRPLWQERESAGERARHQAFLADHRARCAGSSGLRAVAEEETPHQRFGRAIGLLERCDAGEPVGEAALRWLKNYMTSSEYRAELAIRENAKGTVFGT